MLSPRKVKYRKRQKGMPIKGKAHRGSTISFGEYALITLEPVRLTARQIEAARVATNRHIKRQGRMWIRIFPDHPLTKKPAETRMGKGKGSPEEWVAVVRPGRVLYELDGVSEELAREAFKLAGAKLPIKTQFISRKDQL